MEYISPADLELLKGANMAAAFVQNYIKQKYNMGDKCTINQDGSIVRVVAEPAKVDEGAKRANKKG